MELHFLGTNGWYSANGSNTVCAALVSGDRIIVLDAGDGLWRLSELANRHSAKNIDIFLSHVHLDHVIGLHSICKVERECKSTKIRLFANKHYIPNLRDLLARPYTFNPNGFSSSSFEMVGLGEEAQQLPYMVRSLPMEHADPCWGFRFELEGKAISYCTDTGKNANLIELSKNADVLITECSLLPGTVTNPAWPHMSPELAAECAKQSGVKSLFLTHFGADAYSSPADRRKACEAAKKIFNNTICAEDDMKVKI